jgi:hypothetical protein
MAEIKNIRMIRDKWQRVTPQRTEDYKIGVQAPKRSWSDSALKQKETWKAAITAAAQAGLYERGISRTGDDGWKNQALAKGPSRFAEGVMISADKYEERFQPYADTIAKTTLPPRMPKGDPRNIERVKAIADALRKQKVGK